MQIIFGEHIWRDQFGRPFQELGVRQGSIGGQSDDLSKWAPNLESSLGQLSKFGELIVPALQIETLKSIYWSLSNVHQASGSSAMGGGAFGVSVSPNDLLKWAPNLESSLVRLSKFGELIVKALQIENF